jgi:hypothetical protein
MNNLPAGPVLPGMRIHRQNGLPGAPIGPEPIPTDTPARRHRWRPRRRGDRGNARRAAGAGTPPGQTGASETAPGETAASESAAVQTAPGETVAAAVQLVIGLLTASLDSPGLEAWAVEALTPHDPDGMGNFMAGLHLVSQILLHELHEATGEPPEAVMQRLAFLAEHWRESSSG